MHIADQDVVIRDFRVEDVPKKVEWINNPKNNQYLHYDLPLRIEETQAWFYQRNVKNRLDCIIEYQEKPVGLIGLLNIDFISLKAEFYISMGELEFKKRGISTIATNLLTRYGFSVLGLNKIYLNVDRENLAARRLYERTGFCCEGIFLQDLFHRGVLVDRMRYAKFNTEKENQNLNSMGTCDWAEGKEK